MASLDDFDEVVEQYHLALNEFFNGNPDPVKSFFSHRDDVTLANPLVGLPARGWERVAATLEHASSQFTDGENVGFETVAKYVSAELAYVLLIERDKVKVGASEDTAPSLLRSPHPRPHPRSLHPRTPAPRTLAPPIPAAELPIPVVARVV